MSLAAISCGGDDLGLQVAAGGEGDGPIFEPPPFPGLPTDAIVPSTSAGSLAGSLDVTPLGSASYSMPLDVPPGRRGVQPSLSLTYDSNAGSSWLGVGFAISGLPSTVRRCATPAPPTDGNGQVPNSPTQLDEGVIAYDDEDGVASYCWGSERLIRLPSDVEEYRPWTSPNTRLRVSRTNDDRIESWEAELPSGRVLHFEHIVFGTAHETSDAGVRSARPGRVIEWALSREHDLHGNTIEYVYDTRREVDANSYLRHRLSEIRYTGFTRDGETVPGLRSVRFVTERRPDVMTWRRHGVAMISDERLARVEMYGPDVNGAVRRFWYYRFDYRNADSVTERSLLRRVRQCDANDVCTFPTRFDWEAGSLDVEAAGAGPETGGHHAVADMDGDGFDEVLVGPYASDNPYVGPLGGDPNGLDATWRRYDQTGADVAIVPIHWAPAVVDLTNRARHDLLGGRYGSPVSCGLPNTTTDRLGPCSTARDVPAWYQPTRYETCTPWDRVPPSAENDPPWEPGLRTPGRADDKQRCWRDLDPDDNDSFYGVQSDGFWLPSVGEEAPPMEEAGPDRGWNRVRYAPRFDAVLYTERVAGLIPSSQASVLALTSLIPGSFSGDPDHELLLLDPPDAAFSPFPAGFPMLYGAGVPPAFAPTPIARSGTFEALVTASLQMSQGATHVADFDGDGHTDALVSLRTSPTDGPSTPLPTYGMIRFGNGGRARLSITTLPTPALYTLGPSAGRQRPELKVVMDVNGDGLPDVVDPSDVDRSGRTAVYFNEAGSFTPRFYLRAPGNRPLAMDDAPVAREVRARAIDWDLDGRSDLMILDDNPRVLLSRTDRFVVRPLPFEVGGVLVRPVPEGAEAIATRPPVLFADITGDGIDDVLVGNRADSYRTFARYARTTERPDRLRAVVSGSGARSRVEYATLRDASSGTPCWEVRVSNTFDVPPAGDGTPMPAFLGCARATTQVVSRLFEPTDVDGARGENEHVYRYRHGSRDRSGALLGFERVEHFDSAGGRLEEVAYAFEEATHEWSPLPAIFYSERRASVRVARIGWVVRSSTEAHATVVVLEHEGGPVSELGVYRYPGGRDVPSLGLHREMVTGRHTQQLRLTRAEWEALGSGDPELRLVLDRLYFPPGSGPLWFSEEHWAARPDRLGFFEEEATSRLGATTPEALTRILRVPFVSDGAYLHGLSAREEVRSDVVGGSRTRTMAYEWNDRGGLDAAVREPDRETTDPEHVFLRVDIDPDQYGQPVTVTLRDAKAVAGDPEGQERVTTLGYDDLDFTHLRSITNALGQLQWVGMHPTLGVPLVATDANGISGYFRYDGLGRVRETRAPGGARTTYEYRRAFSGRDVLIETRDGGGRIETVLDSLDRPASVTRRLLGGDFGSSVSFDALGRVVEASIPRVSSATGPCVSAQRETDIFGRLTRSSFVRRGTSGGAVTQTVTSWRGSYDVGGTTATFIDTDSVRFAEADHLGRLVRSGDRSGGAEEPRSHTYGAFDLPRESVDAIGATTVLGFDDIGRPTSVQDPDRGAQTITYDAFGDVDSISDPLGTTSFDRDDLGRKLNEHRTEDDVRTTVATFVWDTATNGIGRLDYAAVPATGDTIEYRYDVAGRVQRETRTIAGEIFETDMAYDSVGRLRRIDYPRANGRRFAVFYRYHPASGALNRVESCAAGCAGGAGAREGEVLWELRQVDGLGRPLEEIRGGMTTTRTYDELRGTLSGLTTRDAASTALQQWIYFSDDEDRYSARGEVVSPRIELFGYDTFDRLRTWNVFTGPGFLRLRRTDTFEYEPQGGGRFDLVTSQNFWTGTTTRESYAYPEVAEGRPHAASEVTRSAGGSSIVEGYGYDDRGRQRTGPGRAIDYTHFDLPWRVTTATGTTTFEYDPLHQRTRTIRPEGIVTHVGEIYERRQNGQIGQHVFYVHTPVGLVAQVEELEGSASRTTRYLHDDGLRSVSLITSPTGSTVHGRQWFGPFGQRLALDGTDAPPEVTTVVRGFTEHRQEDSLGLIDMRGRFYDPRLRQFLTPDPLQADPLSSQGTNPYSYVMNRPPNAWDPTGLWDEGWIPVDSDESGTRDYRWEGYPGEHWVTELERVSAAAAARRDGEVLLAQAVAPGELAVVSDSTSSVGGEGSPQATVDTFFRSLLSLGRHDLEVMGRAAWQEIEENGIFNLLMGALIGGAQQVPILNLIVDGGLLYMLYREVVDQWDELRDMAVRFITGTFTDSDLAAVGTFAAQIFTFGRGSRLGVGAVTAAGVGAGTVGALGMVGRAVRGARPRPFTLPGWQRVAVAMEHIADRHMEGGTRTHGRDIFVMMTRSAVHAAIRQAYSNAEILERQEAGGVVRLLLQGSTSTGMVLRMWFNTSTNLIETAWPRQLR